MFQQFKVGDIVQGLPTIGHFGGFHIISDIEPYAPGWPIETVGICTENFAPLSPESLHVWEPYELTLIYREA